MLSTSTTNTAVSTLPSKRTHSASAAGEIGSTVKTESVHELAALTTSPAETKDNIAIKPESEPSNVPTSPQKKKRAFRPIGHVISASSHAIPVPVQPLRVKLLSEHARLPVRSSHLAAGYDLCSARDMEIPAGGRDTVPTDLAMAIPLGTYGRVAPRSGLARRLGIDVGAGVIDADYRGPLEILLFNFGTQPFIIRRGDRIAQMVLERIITPEVFECSELDSTERGANGFGSTGIGS